MGKIRVNKKQRPKNIFRSSEVIIDNEGIVVCPYCKGSGLNDEYELFNYFQLYFGFLGRAYCLKCYGKGRTDWVEVANGRIDEEMKKWIAQHGRMEFNDIKSYLFFINYGVYRNDENEWFFYDHDSDQWEETESYIGIDHSKAKNELSDWLKKFFHDGYITNIFGGLNVYMRLVHDGYLEHEFAIQIKDYILDSTEMTIEKLLKIKEDLSFLGFTIDDLNEIENDEGSGDHSLDSFRFTWDNLLEKFGLPRVHKYSELPDGVLKFDLETKKLLSS